MSTLATTRALLLRRSGLMFVEPGADVVGEAALRDLDVQLASLGFAASTRLRAVLARQAPDQVATIAAEVAEALGGFAARRKHLALFRGFPAQVPTDTYGLWLRRVLVHFCQAEDQPCLCCRRRGTTHVLSPCMHVICDHCFDGANYRACPVCTRTVDPSPFFQPDPADLAPSPRERVRFRLLDLGDDLVGAARSMFEAFCARPQAMSPTDRADFTALIADLGAALIPWIPARVPVKENLALLLGTLFATLDAAVVLPIARRLLTTATDILRFIAALSGADVALQPVAKLVAAGPVASWARWPTHTREALAQQGRRYPHVVPRVAVQARRFKVAKLSRAMRRALLALLDGLDPDRLAEDMLRHRAAWIGVGERLHPHEYATRFPHAARGFAIVRGQGPDGAPPPPFRSFNARVDTAVRARDSAALIGALRERPGELGRRFDHALRIAGDDPAAVARTVAALIAAAPALSMPVLLTLHALLPTRARPAPIRMYWPKGQLALGAAGPDLRPPLRADAIGPAARAVEDELLRRFAARPAVEDAVVDAALARIMVPFNERTASRAAVALPRGSSVALPEAKAVRLFLHWCQPRGGEQTDVDLSVAFYDAAWTYRGVCSYYQLSERGLDGAIVARSSGDRTDAPYPDGASEFVDIDRAVARTSGFRYAAMVVNAYAGLPFSQLERATAGVMLRDELGGAHFDPRTVALAFDLQGDNGMFLPLVVDLERDRIHWLDVYAPGKLQFNNVATSNKDIARLGPQLLDYFGSGVRASMFDLGLLHAAARARRVLIRSATGIAVFHRGADEAAAGFLARLRAGVADMTLAEVPALASPALAVLLHGDLELPTTHVAYALFREHLTSAIAASDLLA
jgi:hypothetical protein